MSNCTFQSQLVSIMEILAKAAVAEINKRVNDSCAVIRLEMRRSQRDVDALKRKYNLLENEVRRTRGRARKKVPMYVISDRFTPTPSSVCVEEEEEEGGVWREDPVSVTLNSDHTQPSLVEEPCIPATDTVPLIKVETEEEENMWTSEEGQVTFSHQELDAAEAPQEETKASRTTADGQHDTHSTHATRTTHTGQEGRGEEGGEGGQVSLEVQVQVKVEDGRRTEEEEAKEEEEEEEEEERSDGLALGEQEPLQQEEGDFVLEQHSTPVWTTTVNDFMTETYTHHHHHVQPLSLPAPQPQPQLPPAPLVVPGAGTVSLPSGGPSGSLLLGRTRAHARWGGAPEQCHPPNNPRMFPDPQPHGSSRSQLSLRPTGSGGGAPAGLTGLGLGGYRGNTSVGGFGSSGGGGFHSSALRRLRPHQWRSVGAVGSAMASSSSSSSSSSSTALACVGALERSRVYACQFCPKSFARLSQLKEHLRSHTGERPFSCGTCGRRFTKHCNLLRHAVVHSGEKPYRCPTCHKCFTQSSSLKSHQRTHLMHHAAAPPTLTPRREGVLMSRVQLRGALMSGAGGAGAAQGCRGYT